MNRSDRDPDAYDRIRDDKLTEQKPEWYVSPDVIGAGMNARLQEQAARIAELEAQLAAVRLLIVAIDECLICNPNPAERIVELICDPFRNPFAAQMQSRKRGTAAAQPASDGQEGE